MQKPRLTDLHIVWRTGLAVCVGLRLYGLNNDEIGATLRAGDFGIGIPSRKVFFSICPISALPVPPWLARDAWLAANDVWASARNEEHEQVWQEFQVTPAGRAFQAVLRESGVKPSPGGDA